MFCVTAGSMLACAFGVLARQPTGIEHCIHCIKADSPHHIWVGLGIKVLTCSRHGSCAEHAAGQQEKAVDGRLGPENLYVASISTIYPVITTFASVGVMPETQLPLSASSSTQCRRGSIPCHATCCVTVELFPRCPVSSQGSDSLLTLRAFLPITLIFVAIRNESPLKYIRRPTCSLFFQLTALDHRLLWSRHVIAAPVD